MNSNDEIYFSYKAIQKMPATILKNIDELSEFIYDNVQSLLNKKNINYSNGYVYAYNLAYNTYGKDIYFNINTINTNKERGIRISVDYLIDMGKYNIHLSIEADRNKFLEGDGFVWLFEYIYQKNPKLLEKITDLVKLEEGYVSLYSTEKKMYRNSLEFEISKNKRHVCKFLIDALNWVFNQNDIIAILRGNKWLEGYCPPPPY